MQEIDNFILNKIKSNLPDVYEMYKAQFKADSSDEESDKRIKFNVKLNNTPEKYTYIIPHDLTIKHKKLYQDLKLILKSRKIKTLYELIDYFNECCKDLALINGFTPTYLYIPEMAEIIAINIYKYDLEKDEHQILKNKLENWRIRGYKGHL
jgi:hypothetical protein